MNRILWPLLLLAVAPRFCPAAEASQEPLRDETHWQTLFAFDEVSIPYSQNLRLEMRQPEKHPANPVVRRGQRGTPDAQGVQFYGSVIREGDKYRMWYVAVGDELDDSKSSSGRWRAAYAESRDGLHWTKPPLGLAEHRGSKQNNLILTDPSPLGFVNLKVLKDAKDPDPARRYKISTHVYFRTTRRLGTLAPFVSADGLRWQMTGDAETIHAELSKEDLVLPALHFEPCGGLYQWNGMFYASGQNALSATRPYHGRVARMYRSPDFIHWSPTDSLSFVRESQHQLLGSGRSLEGEQVHEGISVWNRRNVLLGVYGRWHGAKVWPDVSIDLGFVLSNDGLRFREPAHEWTFLKRGEDGQWDQGGLLQAQGFENIGEQTFIYYGAWDPRQTGKTPPPPRGGVGVATLPRDRLGDLVVELAGEGPGDYQQPVVQSEFVTAAVALDRKTVPRFLLNADGLGPQAALRIELLDEHERPLAGYSGKDAAIVRHAGFQTPISFGSNQPRDLPARIRFRVTFEGPRRTDIRFSALYVADGW